MKKKAIQLLSRKVGRTLVKNSPTIFTWSSVAGLVGTVVMAVEATPRALELIKEERYDRTAFNNLSVNDTHLTKKEIFKLAWKCYIPTAIMGGLTVACIISANSINQKRNAALASLYSLTAATLKEYQTKVVETLGEKKEQVLREEISKDTIQNHPPIDSEIIITGKGNTLCYDVVSGRYFRNDIENLRKVQNDLNREFLDGEMFISLNDMYYAIGLQSTKLGDEIGWAVDDGMIEFVFNSQLANGSIPCLVLDYTVIPRFNYDLP